MLQIPFLIPILSIFSSFIVILSIRFLDIFEKEPFKLLFINFIFGTLAYLISVIFITSMYQVINFNSLVINFNNKFIFISVIFSAGIMLISQLIFASLSFLLFKNEFDSMPDYIIYFSTIGIGFSFGEVFCFDLININNNEFLSNISNNLYFTSFFNGTTLPFLMGGIGAGFYLLFISKRKKLKNINDLSILIIIIAISIQLLFYVMNYLTIIETVHSPSKYLNIVNELKYFSQNSSIALLISAVGFSVIFDAYIISIFVEKVFLLNNMENIKNKNLSTFINPFSYLPISNLKYFSRFKNNSNFSDKDLRRFAKLALKDFNNNITNDELLIEARNILINKSSKKF